MFFPKFVWRDYPEKSISSHNTLTIFYTLLKKRVLVKFSLDKQSYIKIPTLLLHLTIHLRYLGEGAKKDLRRGSRRILLFMRQMRI